MRMTERRLRRIIRSVIKESKPLISEVLKKGFQIVDKPTVLNAITTDVREFCSPSMLYDYDTLGVGVLVDMDECQDFIKTLYIAERRGIDVPNFSAKIVPSNFGKAVQVSVLGPISEDFFELFYEIQKEAQGDEILDISSKTLEPSTVNNSFIFSPEDNVRIINSTTTWN